MSEPTMPRAIVASDAHRVVARDDGAGQEPGDEADDEHDDDEGEHGCLRGVGVVRREGLVGLSASVPALAGARRGAAGLRGRVVGAGLGGTLLALGGVARLGVRPGRRVGGHLADARASRSSRSVRRWSATFSSSGRGSDPGVVRVLGQVGLVVRTWRLLRERPHYP